MKLITIKQRRRYAWTDGALAAFDIETTSVDPLTAKLVSAALVIDDPANGQQSFSWLVQIPEIPLDAVQVHGISPEHAMKHGNPLDIVLADIKAKLEALQIPLCMCNGSYDLTIIDRELRRTRIAQDGLSLSGLHIVDSLVLDRSLDPFRRGRRTLTATMAAYGLAIRGAHQANFDCVAVINLVRAIARRHPWVANADLNYLQNYQRRAYAQWAKGYEGYRRKYGDQDFRVSGAWPMIPYEQ